MARQFWRKATTTRRADEIRKKGGGCTFNPVTDTKKPAKCRLFSLDVVKQQ